jgi:DNA-binding transcriptional ArsR family regulator
MRGLLKETRMPTTNAFAEIGSLVGDPGRANMLVALMDGRALTATELAATAGITPQTASSHLGQLVGANLLTVERQGRHRYHRLADPAIARMIEGMMAVATNSTVGGRPATRTGPNHIAMRQARTCYDHLAGRIAVAIADSMVAQGEVELSPDGGILTPWVRRCSPELGSI